MSEQASPKRPVSSGRRVQARAIGAMTLAELQLLQLGLWLLGQQDRVDKALLPVWHELNASVTLAIQVKLR